MITEAADTVPIVAKQSDKSGVEKVTDEDYARYIEKNLRDFWKPGQKLRSPTSSGASPEDRIHCALCEWLSTSRAPVAQGLINVLVLENLDTGARRYIGCNCAERYQSHLRKITPDFEIAGLEEAKQRLEELRQAKQARAQGPSLRLHPTSLTGPQRRLPPKKKRQFGSVNVGPTTYTPEPYSEEYEELMRIWEEHMSQEEWMYYQERIPTRKLGTTPNVTRNRLLGRGRRSGRRLGSTKFRNNRADRLWTFYLQKTT